MKLPQFLADKISNYVDEEDYQHQMACHDAGVDPHDIDPSNELPLTLNICFPEHVKADGLRTYRTIDWVETWDTFWIPAHRGLRLCKIGWHLWGCYYEGHRAQRYQDAHARCTSCGTKRHGWMPRWAR